MKYTLTSKVLLPLVKWGSNFNTLVSNGFINSYIGYYDLEEDNWGEYIYLHFHNLPNNLLSELAERNNIMDIHYLSDSILIQIKISESNRQNVVEPFLKGLYTQIDREFVEKYHREYYYDKNGKSVRNRVRQACDNCPLLREELETMYDAVDSDSDKPTILKRADVGELYSSPDKEKEIFNFKISDHDIENRSDARGTSKRFRRISLSNT